MHMKAVIFDKTGQAMGLEEIDKPKYIASKVLDAGDIHFHHRMWVI